MRTTGRVLFGIVMVFLLVLVGDTALAGSGPGGFPLPKDATARGAAPGGGGKIVMFEVPRGRDAVGTEMVALCKADGWTIDSEQESPRGSIRVVVTKNKSTIRASVAGDGDRSTIILTLP